LAGTTGQTPVPLRRTPRTHTRAFTLIETLVTISLIGALLSILLPALSSARGSAQQTVCASNLRQLQFANNFFASEHQGSYIPGAVDIQFSNLKRWHGSREHVGEPFDAASGVITPYLDDALISVRTRRCPTFAPALDELSRQGAGFENSSGGYGYNNAYVGAVRQPGPDHTWTISRDDQGAKRTRFEHPSETLAFADAAFASSQGVGGLIEYSFAEPNFWPDYPGARPNPSIHFRHAGKANVVWLDDHVSSETRTRTWAGLGYGVDSSTVGLGWFAHRDSNDLFDYN